MRIAIVGVGAMGSVYAALLADAGNDVIAVDTDPTQVDAIRASGLRLIGASGERIVRLEATTDPHSVGAVDLVVIATKAMHAADAARSCLPLLHATTLVLPIQNGIGSADAVAAIAGADRTLVGVAGGFGASVLEPGSAHHHGMELVRLGERVGAVTPRLEQIAAVWRAAGFSVQTYDDIDRLVWEKLICNVAFSGVCTILDVTIGDVLDNADAWAISSACAREAYDVARARGIALGFDDPVAEVRAFGEKLRGARPSMLLDRRAGRRSEIDAINGAVPPRAAELGLAAPTNVVVTALVRAGEPAS